ncbi:hypothetical protein KY312_04035 [Candidatus Woesearchaeota archaeon]|nr:hypothetical protein [Candidatus Woesearchaeota archaeon]
MEKSISVAFISEKLKNEFKALKKGKYEDKQLFSFISRAIADISQNPQCGTKIPRKLWPKSYANIYNITNLWKYDLPNAWRMLYTIEIHEIQILNIIIEWFSHKGYERRFKY